MLRIRIVATAAATAIIVALAQSGAAAQAASADQSGQPLSLLKLITHTSPTASATTASAAHADSAGTAGKKIRIRKVAGKKHTRIAAAQDADMPADAPQSTASADAWLAASATPANSASASPPAETAPASPSDNAQPDPGPLPSTIQIGGQIVHVAAADQVNEIDLAADTPPPHTPTNTPSMESTEPPSDRADAHSDVLAMADATENAGAQNADAQNISDIGSASWIAQVLAALGGAIAAGVVAWFLIGAGPARTYG